MNSSINVDGASGSNYFLGFEISSIGRSSSKYSLKSNNNPLVYLSQENENISIDLPVLLTEESFSDRAFVSKMFTDANSLFDGFSDSSEGSFEGFSDALECSKVDDEINTFEGFGLTQSCNEGHNPSFVGFQQECYSMQNLSGSNISIDRTLEIADIRSDVQEQSKRFTNEKLERVKPDSLIKDEFIGEYCKKVGCTVNWLESGKTKRVSICNGIVFELSEFAKKIAWEKEYVARWIFRLRGYTTEPTDEDLSKIHYLLKRRKALTVTFSGKLLLKSKLSLFDAGEFSLPTAERLDIESIFSKSESASTKIVSLPAVPKIVQSSVDNAKSELHFVESVDLKDDDISKIKPSPVKIQKEMPIKDNFLDDTKRKNFNAALPNNLNDTENHSSELKGSKKRKYCKEALCLDNISEKEYKNESNAAVLGKSNYYAELENCDSVSKKIIGIVVNSLQEFTRASSIDNKLYCEVKELDKVNTVSMQTCGTQSEFYPEVQKMSKPQMVSRHVQTTADVGTQTVFETSDSTDQLIKSPQNFCDDNYEKDIESKSVSDMACQIDSHIMNRDTLPLDIEREACNSLSEKYIENSFKNIKSKNDAKGTRYENYSNKALAVNVLKTNDISYIDNSIQTSEVCHKDGISLYDNKNGSKVHKCGKKYFPIFEVGDNYIGSVCSALGVTVEDLNSVEKQNKFVTNAMVRELHYFFKKNNASLTSLVHILYRLKGKDVDESRVLSTVKKISELVLDWNSRLLWQPNFKNLEFLFPRQRSTVEDVKNKILLDNNNDEDLRTSDIIDDVSSNNGIFFDNKPTEPVCDTDSMIDNTNSKNFDIYSTIGKEGYITRGDIVILYKKWVTSKIESKDSVFVTDLQKTVEDLLVERKVQPLRIPVGTLMSSSVKLYEEFNKHFSNSPSEAKQYLQEDWLEDICYLVKMSKQHSFVPFEETKPMEVPLKRKLGRPLKKKKVEKMKSRSSAIDKSQEFFLPCKVSLEKSPYLENVITGKNLPVVLYNDEVKSSRDDTKFDIPLNHARIVSDGGHADRFLKVKKILCCTSTKDNTLKTKIFKVHWEGLKSNLDTWIKEENLNCPELIKQFLESSKLNLPKRVSDNSNNECNQTCGLGNSNENLYKSSIDQDDYQNISDGQSKEMDSNENSSTDQLDSYKFYARRTNTTLMQNVILKVPDTHQSMRVFDIDTAPAKVRRLDVLNIFNNWRLRKKTLLENSKTGKPSTLDSLVNEIKSLMASHNLILNPNVVVTACLMIAFGEMKHNKNVFEYQKYLNSDCIGVFETVEKVLQSRNNEYQEYSSHINTGEEIASDNIFTFQQRLLSLKKKLSEETTKRVSLLEKYTDISQRLSSLESLINTSKEKNLAKHLNEKTLLLEEEFSSLSKKNYKLRQKIVDVHSGLPMINKPLEYLQDFNWETYREQYVAFKENVGDLDISESTVEDIVRLIASAKKNKE